MQIWKSFCRSVTRMPCSSDVAKIVSSIVTQRGKIDILLGLLRCGILSVGTLMVILSGRTAWSQPAQTIKIVVPFGPGSSIDLLARVLAEQVRRNNGPTMVIESRPGAGAIVATEAAARAAPDGNTLL